MRLHRPRPAQVRDDPSERPPPQAVAPPPEPRPPHPRFHAPVAVTAATDTGRARTSNEDSIGVFGWIAPLDQPVPVALASAASSPLVVIVADGLGGHAAGEVASQHAVRQLMAAGPALDTEDGIRQAVLGIHAELLQRGRTHPGYAGMATTLAAVVITPGAVLCVHVGDSRIYYVESGLLDQLTSDDAVAGTLQQCLGGRADADVMPHIRRMSRTLQARYLICSDGLHGCVPRDTIRDLAAIPDPLTAAARLVSAAFQAGAPDNISLCLVDVAPAAGLASPPGPDHGPEPEKAT
jgi:PPM family protein phosphatase